MSPPRYSRRRVLVEIRRLQGALTRADVAFARASDWRTADVDAARRELRRLEVAITGRKK